MKLTFKQFERATALLENAPDEISDDVLLESGITREDLEKINEGLLGDIFGGIFKKLKEKILKAVPGSVLKKVDSILAEYKKVQMEISDKTQKERDKIFTANAEDKDSERNKEQVKRSEKAIEAIEAASKSKKDAINNKLQLVIKDKSDIVKNYVNMQMYQIQEDIATKQLKDAEKLASEEELDRLEKVVAEKKKKKEDAAKAIENAKVKEKEEAEKKESEKIKKLNDPETAEKGQKWIYKTTKDEEVEVTIVGDLDKPNKQIQVKGKKGPFPVKIERLIRRVDQPQQKQAA